MKSRAASIRSAASLILICACALTAAGCVSGSSAGGKKIDGFRGVAQIPPDLERTPAPPIDLADARGGRLATASLRGRPYAVTFLYTRCPDVCPLIGAELRTALSQMGAKASRVAVVGVSVDPRGDTPKTVEAWLKIHHEPANFHYLIGTTSQLKPVWKSYFAAPQIEGDPNSTHTAAIWFVDGKGRLRAQMDGGTPIAPSDIAYDFNVLLEGK